MNRHIFETEQEVIAAYAKFFTGQAGFFIQTQGIFNVSLSGGSSPKRVYELLASPAFKNKVDWGKVYFFFGDERYVPATDDRYNGLMADKALFQPLQIAADHIFKMDTSLPPARCAEKYMEAITGHFRNKPIRFDFIMLGLGDDAHTASLFPFTSVLNEKEAAVREVYLEKDDAYRITFTAPLINQASQIAFLVFGKNKAAAVKEVMEGEKNPAQFPAQLIQPAHGEVHWFMDAAAA